MADQHVRPAKELITDLASEALGLVGGEVALQPAHVLERLLAVRAVVEAGGGVACRRD